jgi:UDP-perosamine 4-acetyltransferase
MKTVLVGSGGHAKVIIDILRHNPEVELAGCTSSDPECREVMGLPVLGTDAVLPSLLQAGVTQAFVAIGDNRARVRVAREVAGLGFFIINAIHPCTTIAPSVKLGKGIAVMAGVVINPDTMVADYAVVNTGATVDHDGSLGEGCHLAPGTHLAGNVSIGAGAFLGVGCSAIPEVSVGDWSVVGAGAAIVADIPAKVLALGVPARVIKNCE